jgi:hypothetical protein
VQLNPLFPKEPALELVEVVSQDVPTPSVGIPFSAVSSHAMDELVFDSAGSQGK